MRLLAILFILWVPLSPAWAETVKMTTGQAVQLYNALAALDGYDKITKDGASEKVSRANYAFGGGVRTAIGRNLAALQQVVQVFEKAKKGVFLQLADGKDKLEGDAIARFSKETDAMLDAPVAVDITKLKILELKMEPPDGNPIPGTVLLGLQPMLTE